MSQIWHRLWPLGALAFLALALPAAAQATDADIQQQRDCARKMRRLFEATQAYRRLHQGKYPEKIASLTEAGLISPDASLCPCILQSRAFSALAHGTWTSTGESYDSSVTYQYELSEKPIDPPLLPEGVPSATWRKMKTEMIQRPHWEDVPVLRCERHSASGDRLNLSFAGRFYRSGSTWESLFVEHVPQTYRTPCLVLSGRVPPFVKPEEVGSVPENCLVLAAACNALPQDPWWWGNRTAYDQRKTATLQALLDESPSGLWRREAMVFQVRFLVQVQGATVSKGGKGYVDRCFPATVSIPVGRRLHEATILAGTVWPEKAGHTVGALLWTYDKGPSEGLALVSGRNIDCFRARIPAEAECQPCWKGLDSEKRSISLFAARWTNPHPDRLVSHVEFRAQPESPAAPFIAAISLLP